MGFASGFESGSRVVREAQRMADEQAMKDGLKEISDAKPVDNIQPVDPNYDGADGPAMASKGVMFLGKNYDTAPTDSQMSAARNQAMAGVVKKYDPIRGIQLENDAKRNAREEEAYSREEAHRKDRQDAFGQTSFSTGQKQYADGMKTYEDQKKQYDADLAEGKTGLVAPLAPSKPQFSIGDTMLDNAKLFAVDAKHGKVDPDKFMAYSNAMRKLGDEGYAQTLKLAQGGAPIADVLANYNKNGQDKIDPSQVVSDKMVKGKDGVPSRVIEFKGADGQLHAINAMAELDKLGEADKIFTRHFQNEQLGISKEQLEVSKGHLGISQSQLALSQNTQNRAIKKEDEAAAARGAIYGEQNPGATPAAIQAARTGIIPAVPDAKSYKVEMNEVTSALGTPAVDSSGKPMSDPMTGRQIVNRNPDKEAAFFAWMQANKITDTNKGLYMYLGNGGAAPKAGGAPAAQGGAPAAPAANQYKQGQEMTIKAGANAGKTAVFDGKGWVLKP